MNALKTVLLFCAMLFPTATLSAAESNTGAGSDHHTSAAKVVYEVQIYTKYGWETVYCTTSYDAADDVEYKYERKGYRTRIVKKYTY